MEICTGVETLDAPEDSQPSIEEDSVAETQVFHDPDATQFADTQVVDWSDPVDESCLFSFNVGDYNFIGKAKVTASRVLRELDMIEFHVRPSRSRPGSCSARIELHELETYVSRWEAVRVVSPTQTPLRKFTNELSYADVGLSDTTLDLKFLPGDKLVVTLNNTLRGPIENHIMVFECVYITD